MLSDDGRERNMNQLLFADDAPLAAHSHERLRQLGKKNWRVCQRRKLRVNVSRNKIMQRDLMYCDVTG